MKTIGLIGGMSWESTVTYYQVINEIVKDKLGGFHSGKIILYSVDFAPVEESQTTGRWDLTADILSEAAKSLERAGADFILICTNTMHKVAPEVQASVKVPILHIAEAVSMELKNNNITKVGLLGTKYTMQMDFYKDILKKHGIEVVIPAEEDIEIVNNVIYNELCLGEIKDSSRKAYLEIMDKLKTDGAQGIILGCTEIGLLVNQENTSIPLFDTTLIHARKAALRALE